MNFHQSVLAKEVLEWIAPGPGETIFDGTLGLGGHAALILERLGSTGTLIGFDRDPEALEEARRVLARFGGQAMLVHEDFRNVKERLAGLGVGSVDAMLLDLGVSSKQLGDASRGFSFRGEGPLDMRMNPAHANRSKPIRMGGVNPPDRLTAADIVNTYPERELADLFWNYGEERYARRIARAIVEQRGRRPIETTRQLAAVVSSAVPGAYRHGRIHPATRTFQALRIAVNRELEALKDFLKDFIGPLRTGGKVAIISFHSLEDRLVKTAFRELERSKRGKVLTKKPIRPGAEEVGRNPRSRSARMRVFEKA